MLAEALMLPQKFSVDEARHYIDGHCMTMILPKPLVSLKLALHMMVVAPGGKTCALPSSGSE